MDVRARAVFLITPGLLAVPSGRESKFRGVNLYRRSGRCPGPRKFLSNSMNLTDNGRLMTRGSATGPTLGRFPSAPTFTYPLESTGFIAVPALAHAAHRLLDSITLRLISSLPSFSLVRSSSPRSDCPPGTNGE